MKKNHLRLFRLVFYANVKLLFLQILPLQQQHRWAWDQTSQSCWILFDFCLKLGSEALRVFPSVIFNIVEYSNNQNCCFQQKKLPSITRDQKHISLWGLRAAAVTVTNSLVNRQHYSSSVGLLGFPTQSQTVLWLPHLKDVENWHVTAKQLSYNKSGRWRTQALLLKGFQWTHVCTMVTPYIGD